MHSNHTPSAAATTAIRAAVQRAGSQVALAKQLGVSHVSVHQWVVRGFAPRQRAVEIHALYPEIPVLGLVDPSISALLAH